MAEKTAVEWDKMEWLHVYGQHTYHSEATIRGTVEGLTALRSAIDAAIADGTGAGRVIASDGEGYSVEVVRVSTHGQLGSPEYLYELHGRLMAEEAERAREFGLRNPYGQYKRIGDDPAFSEAPCPDSPAT